MGYVLLGISSVVGVSGTVSPVGLTERRCRCSPTALSQDYCSCWWAMVYDKAHTRHIPDMSGLANRMPITAAVFVIAGLASLGLPGTSGFVSEI